MLRQLALVSFIGVAAIAAREQHEHSAAPAVLGKVHFPISCAQSQTRFDRALLMLHGFWYQQGLDAFTEITRTDPACAMAYWGMAELLLASGNPAKALTEFEASLAVSRNRFRGVYGAAKAAEKSGAASKARKYHERLVAVSDQAHPSRPELLEAIAFLSSYQRP